MLLVATVIKNTVQIVDKVVKRIFKLVMQSKALMSRKPRRAF